jgi:(p)ppGpp synthase/HD superfamily hydrolase
MYSHTNIQLFDQLIRQGYSTKEIGTVLYSYELSVHLFTGRFQPSGNVFISHTVRTASILAGLQAPAEVIAAGLIHSVYWTGDFGDAGTGISDSKRNLIRQAVGEAVEEYVYRYCVLPWNIQSIPILRNRIDELGLDERNVILMKLANDLEHHLDGELLYYGYKERQRLIQQGDIMVDLAQKLGFPKLADDLSRVVKKSASAEVPEEIQKLTNSRRKYEVILASGEHESRVILPRSCKSEY